MPATPDPETIDFDLPAPAADEGELTAELTARTDAVAAVVVATVVLVRERGADGTWAGRTEERFTLASPDRAAAMARLLSRGPVRVVDGGRRTVDVLALSF